MAALLGLSLEAKRLKPRGSELCSCIGDCVADKGSVSMGSAYMLGESIPNEEHPLMSSPVPTFIPAPASLLVVTIRATFFEIEDCLENLVDVCLMTFRMRSSSFSLPNLVTSVNR